VTDVVDIDAIGIEVLVVPLRSVHDIPSITKPLKEPAASRRS
jgi:hypothetical protein